MAYENFYATKLQAQISASDTTMQVQKAPVVTSGWLVIEARNVTQREIVRFTGVSGNTLTGVVRGQQGTIAVSHPNGASVEMNPTAQDFDDALNVNSNIPQTIVDIFGKDIAGKTTFAVVPGLEWSVISGLNASMVAGSVYIQGVKIPVPAIASRTFPASKDSYVYIDVNGSPVYVPVNNGDPAPTKPADTVRVAKIVTSASAVTGVVDLRERPLSLFGLDGGSTAGVLTTDENGEVKKRNEFWLKTRTLEASNGAPGSTTVALNLFPAPTASIEFDMVEGHTYKVSFHIGLMGGSGGTGRVSFQFFAQPTPVFNGSTAKRVGIISNVVVPGGSGADGEIVFTATASGKRYLHPGINTQDLTGTLSFNASASNPAYFSIERVYPNL